jgi:hypothetical protein
MAAVLVFSLAANGEAWGLLSVEEANEGTDDDDPRCMYVVPVLWI